MLFYPFPTEYKTKLSVFLLYGHDPESDFKFLHRHDAENYFDAVSGVINYIGTFSLVSELLLYYMVWQMTSEYSSRIQLQLINQQNDYQKQHMKDLNTIVTEYHHLRHDTKNHFACMDRLLSQNKYDALKEYFYNLSKEIYALDNQIETGNEIVNQVINLKYATAHKYQIPMDIQIVLPPHLSIPDHHLCSLVANLLDNAIEASRKIEDPKIVIEMKMVRIISPDHSKQNGSFHARQGTYHPHDQGG